MKPAWKAALALSSAVTVSAVVLVSSAGTASAQTTSAPAVTSSKEPRLDEQALAMMRRSAEFLAGQSAMSFNWFVSYDEVIEGREKLTFMRSGTNLLVREKGFYSRAEGENGIREWHYDGKQVAFVAPAENYYATGEFTKGFDALVDSARENMGSEIPIYAIMRRGLPERLAEGLKGAAYLGITRVAGQEVHHLAFSDDEEDWQVWISTDEQQPVPVVIVGTEPKKTGWPQYRAYLTDWNFKPEYDAAQFIYTPGEGTVKISFPDLTARIAGEGQGEAAKTDGAAGNTDTGNTDTGGAKGGEGQQK
jgi:hypothetical protein